jgi:ubiquinone/menaquinone biosynthesis C-methylase UbiE
MTSITQKTYLPAAGHDWTLPLYDPLVKLLGGDSARRVLLEEADLRPGHRILDLGCGTGTLLVLLKQLHPDVDARGLDPDPKALARAARKARRAAVSIQFDRGFSDDLPYPDASFDRILSSFMFHHLPAGARGKTLQEVRRVLGPGASFHMLDFGGPEPGASALSRVIHSNHRLEDNSTDRVLGLMKQAGFVVTEKVRDGAMLFGHMRTAYYKAVA